MESLSIVNVPRSEFSNHIKLNILRQKSLYEGPKHSGFEQGVNILQEREVICVDSIINAEYSMRCEQDKFSSKLSMGDCVVATRTLPKSQPEKGVVCFDNYRFYNEIS